MGLPCGHDSSAVIEAKDGYWLLRCKICKNLFVLCPDESIIPVEAVFKLSDLKEEGQ